MPTTTALCSSWITSPGSTGSIPSASRRIPQGALQPGRKSVCARPSYSFQPNATQDPVNKNGGNTFADYLLGTLYQSEAAVAVGDAAFVRNGWSFYIDDTWKLTPKITLAIGLRYELTRRSMTPSGMFFSVFQPYEDPHSAGCR